MSFVKGRHVQAAVAVCRRLALTDRRRLRCAQVTLLQLCHYAVLPSASGALQHAGHPSPVGYGDTAPADCPNPQHPLAWAVAGTARPCQRECARPTLTERCDCGAVCRAFRLGRPPVLVCRRRLETVVHQHRGKLLRAAACRWAAPSISSPALATLHALHKRPIACIVNLSPHFCRHFTLRSLSVPPTLRVPRLRGWARALRHAQPVSSDGARFSRAPHRCCCVCAQDVKELIPEFFYQPHFLEVTQTQRIRSRAGMRPLRALTLVDCERRSCLVPPPALRQPACPLVAAR
jgi:hypothetical protein